MAKKFHFISGLPRSGSTLLSALLIQNPDVHAGMSSPLGPLYGVIASNLSAQNEVYSQISEQARKAILRGIFDSYYSDRDKPVIIDTSRYWTSQMAAIAELFPEARMICCVRNVEEIIDSIELLLERNPLETSALFGFRSDGNVVSRAEHARSSKGIVGAALNNLKQAYYGRFSDRVMIVRYERLVDEPLHVLNAIYEFIGEEVYPHRTDHVEFDAELVDLRLGAKGLHTVKGPVRNARRAPQLPPDVIKACQPLNFWASPLQRGSSKAKLL